MDNQPTIADVIAQMSKLIADAGLREPDAIEPGPEPDEVSFIWTEEKLIVIIDRREELAGDLVPAA